MYRGGIPCDAHPFSVAVGRCFDCGNRVCEGCEAFAGMARRCAACTRQFRVQQRAVKGVLEAMLISAMLIVTLSLGAVLGMAQSEIDPPLPALFSLSN